MNAWLQDLPSQLASLGPMLRWLGEQLTWLGTQSSALVALAALIGIAAAVLRVVTKVGPPLFTVIAVLVAVPFLLLGTLVDALSRVVRGNRR